MKFTFKAFAALLFILVIVVSCSKELSFEGNFATISLKAPFTADCLPSSVEGSYIKDTAFTSANYIDVAVAVSGTGYYSISTDTVNGFWFVGEGPIDSLGIRNIQLFAKGKPAAAGTFTFQIKNDTSSCPIQVTVTDAPIAGSAVFTFTDASGGCAIVDFNGTYTQGVALDATNTMEFDVTVITPGTYSLNLPVINGISFSGSGTFTSPGIQHVVLAGSGTPGGAGIITQQITTGSVTCSYNLTISPPDNLPDAVFTLDCASPTLNGTYTASVPMAATNTVNVLATVATAGKFTITTTAVNGVTFAASGTFSAPSATPQPITLVAAGTPAAQGPFNYPVSGNGASCAFDVTYAAAPTPAVYTLAGSPGTCTGAAVNGTYTRGTALGASNTVVVKVDVTTPGVFSLTTNTVNGITFSASGAFVNAGPQDVTLTATGKPTVAGVNTLTPQIGNNSCSFDINVVAPPVSAGVFTCKIDGVFTTFNEVANFTMEPDLAGNLELHLYGRGVSNGNGFPEFSIYIQNNDHTAIKPGTYDEKHFIPTSPTDFGYRISVAYRAINPDNSEVTFSTSSNFLSTNPPFTIVITSISSTRVKGTFSGTLDNSPGGNQSKTITEGVFDLPVE